MSSVHYPVPAAVWSPMCDRRPSCTQTDSAAALYPATTTNRSYRLGANLDWSIGVVPVSIDATLAQKQWLRSTPVYHVITSFNHIFSSPPGDRSTRWEAVKLFSQPRYALSIAWVSSLWELVATLELSPFSLCLSLARSLPHSKHFTRIQILEILLPLLRDHQPVPPLCFG